MKDHRDAGASTRSRRISAALLFAFDRTAWPSNSPSQATEHRPGRMAPGIPSQMASDFLSRLL